MSLGYDSRLIVSDTEFPIFKLLSMVFFYDSFTCVCLLFRVFRVTNHIIIEFGGTEVIFL